MMTPPALRQFSTIVRFVTVATVLVGSLGSAHSLWAVETCSGDPSAATARTWWPALRNVWTPVGVKNHPFRFNVLYNGTVLADPHPLRDIGGHPIKTYLAPFADSGVQLTFVPSLDGSLPPVRSQPYQLSASPDGGVGLQGWDPRPTPLLSTRWPITHQTGNTGVVLREEVFAHTPSGKPVETGHEPLYAWIRLSVEHVDPLDAPPTSTMLIHLGNPSMMQRSMWHEENLTVHPDRRLYPRELRREGYDHRPFSCCRLVEPDGKLRLIAMLTDGSVMLVERGERSHDYFLQVNLPAKQGKFVDFVLPMIPGEAAAVTAEAEVGFDAALEQMDRYWSQRPETAAVVDTPEPEVNEAFRRLTELAQVISETNPANRETSFLTGSWNYDTLWPTPTCMAAHMLLDPLGYHDAVAQNMEIFRNHQGEAKPPGEAYSPDPGYFGAPRELSSIDWLTDHGSVLHTVAYHGLLTDDKQFIDHWLEPILKACEFIRTNRAKVVAGAVPGVLPPAVATDTGVPTQAVWNIAWNYKGLESAVQLLREIKHPAAEKYATEAKQYKQAFVEAFRNRAAKMPTWKDDAGNAHALVPTSLNGPPDQSHPFYLDTGPLVLTYGGLLPGNDPLMQSALSYYREGPPTKLYDPRGNMHQRAILTHEVSSCEPCYSFNIVCSWQTGDRQHFLEGIYGLLAASLSPQTFSGVEHRHGICALVAPGALMVHSMRLAVIDDQIAEDELHLLRLVPGAWLAANHPTRFEKMATIFGPVSLRFQPSADSSELNVSLTADWHKQPKKIVLHAPPLVGLKTLRVNDVVHPAEKELVIETASLEPNRKTSPKGDK